MRPNWWRFWSRSAWSDWQVERRAWTQYRSDRHRIEGRVTAVEAGTKAARADLDDTDRRIAWLEAVQPREVAIKTAKAESGLAVVSDVRLLETRKREGREVWTPIDLGTVHFTDRKMVFSGAKDVQFRFDKITSAIRSDQGLYVAVSTRKRAHVLAGPVDQLEAVLAAARTYEEGADPAAELRSTRAEQGAVVEAHVAELADLQNERSQLARPPRPVSPIWVPVGVFIALGVVGSLLGDQEPTRTDSEAIGAALTPVGTSATTVLMTTTEAAETTSAPVDTTTVPPSTTTTLAAEVASSDDTTPPSTAGEGAPAGFTNDVPEGSVIAAVLSITDGDTIRVRLADGSEEPLRLIGINAPEGGECLADAAAQYLTEQLAGADVGLMSDVSDRDRFDRLLRYVYVDGAFVNEEIVRVGLAIARRYEPDTALASTLEAAQTAAQREGAGMWAPAACGQVSQASIAIGDLAYDAPGNDNDNLNDEWVTITNTGISAADLTGWQIKDESASHRYTFPAGFTLPAGASVILHTGCGTDTGSTLYWCNTGSAIWNNSGDTVFLLDPPGNIIAFYAYDESTPSAAPSTTSTTSTSTSTTTTTTSAAANCHPSYPDVCIPPPPPDLDCGEISFRRFTVVGSDPHRFDGDNDGVGCES